MITAANGKVTISNDGATILSLLDVVHPAARVLVDIARSQDDEVGDGTTSVTLITGELLKQAKPFIEEGIHPQIIVQGFRQALDLALQKLEGFSINISRENPEERRKTLLKCAETALNSKLVSLPLSISSPTTRPSSASWSSTRLRSSMRTFWIEI